MITDVSMPRPAVGSPGTWLRFLAGFAVLYGVLAVPAAGDSSGRWHVVIAAAVLLTAVVAEWVLYAAPVRGLLRRWGLGRPDGRSLATAVGVSTMVLGVYPLFAVVSGSTLALRADWPWVLVGVFAFHGLAEELVWRGYAFRRLREGRSFRSAVLWTMPLVAATHVPIVLTTGLAVGIGAMAVAAATSLPFAHLYEAGRRTLWAPAVLHTAIDSFKLFVIPVAAATTFSLLLVTVSLVVPLLVLALPRRSAVSASTDKASS
ncbi:CPBP family intramembrane metalloprotease [Pseudonocardia sp. DSM 110487]|uniref:CPBP family intramembrane glutamic endopeptidase n=1 Tax=Pseudonocardia sp. DSM 110487 TaxID=2865833 RepID=UPI001C695DEA|nr:CPBP family intramembrane glutamic endopeptidase [Pseudonocardia sp. DSM 110487]QYN38725.1 CPBP family intramembrane metalloprotease [Pseudonocardia sp. DSM 110487]